MILLTKRKTGLWAEVTEAKANDTTCLLLTQGEYSDLQCELHDAGERFKEKEREKADYEIRLAEAEEWMVKQAKNYEVLAEQKEYLEESLEKLQQALRDAQQLNINLLRICKERANADRNIHPKKQQSGYVALSDSECTYKWTKTIDYDFWRKEHPYESIKNYVRFVHHEEPARRILFQTPYHKTLPLEQIKDIVLMEVIDEAERQVGYPLVIMTSSFRNAVSSEWWNVEVMVTPKFI